MGLRGSKSARQLDELVEEDPSLSAVRAAAAPETAAAAGGSPANGAGGDWPRP